MWSWLQPKNSQSSRLRRWVSQTTLRRAYWQWIPLSMEDRPSMDLRTGSDPGNILGLVLERYLSSAQGGCQLHSTLSQNLMEENENEPRFPSPPLHAGSWALLPETLIICCAHPGSLNPVYDCLLQPEGLFVCSAPPRGPESLTVDLAQLRVATIVCWDVSTLHWTCRDTLPYNRC